MQKEELKSLFLKHKETALFHRYITNKHIESLIIKLAPKVKFDTIGTSVLNKPIYGLKIGNGDKRILMWSQMHGNESTTTKALFDLLNTFLKEDGGLNHILSSCTLYIIPILNPDGAELYTRLNANQVDLNRDAQNLTQPESNTLRSAFETFQPHFCYNLHGQRTIFSVGNTNKPATLSFLAPAQDKECDITPNRKVAMEVIGVINNVLQPLIPGQIGIYDDAFNLNCVGDTFQSENVPTILFEAGHYPNDYEREITREYIYTSYLASLDYIAQTDIKGDNYKSYYNIPENGKCFYDVIIRNAYHNDILKDIGIQYQEKLENNKIKFIPKVDKIENLSNFFGHMEIDANGKEVFGTSGEPLKVNNENVCVIINNEKISLLSK
ncbi:MAG: peptidase M14 [Flaviramulus sp.]|nr:M14 metallopeptidase family protein [Flaviramulus sp.]NNC49069.1 peptidase M14 [Flaviramulus sp.]